MLYHINRRNEREKTTQIDAKRCDKNQYLLLILYIMKTLDKCKAWWFPTVISALGRLEQEDRIAHRYHKVRTVEEMSYRCLCVICART